MIIFLRIDEQLLMSVHDSKFNWVRTPNVVYTNMFWEKRNQYTREVFRMVSIYSGIPISRFLIFSNLPITRTRMFFPPPPLVPSSPPPLLPSAPLPPRCNFSFSFHKARYNSSFQVLLPLGARSHHAWGIWKGRFHTDTRLWYRIKYFPSTGKCTGEIWKRTITGHFLFVLWVKLGQENIVIEYRNAVVFRFVFSVFSYSHTTFLNSSGLKNKRFRKSSGFY